MDHLKIYIDVCDNTVRHHEVKSERHNDIKRPRIPKNRVNLNAKVPLKTLHLDYV